MRKIYWLQVLQQCFSEPDIRLNIPDGLTLEQVLEIEQRITDETESYGEKNNGDYSDLDYYDMVEKVLRDMGISYSYPPVEYTIYI